MVMDGKNASMILRDTHTPNLEILTHLISQGSRQKTRPKVYRFGLRDKQKEKRKKKKEKRKKEKKKKRKKEKKKK